MATYKVIQDIEAEDKILGPLTLRQFIFAIIALFLFYLCFIMIRESLWLLLVLFLPPALFFGFFAMPFGRDQPTEIWALAKLRYYFKPRQRIWNQSGVKELVTITVPKKIEQVLSDGLSQTEVKSRLQALANTIDSRGWAIKNVNVHGYSPRAVHANSDRLLDITDLPPAVPEGDITASDDILDERSNPIAQQFTSMINQSSQTHRQELMDEMNDVRAAQPKAGQPAGTPPADYWFMNDSQMSGADMPAPAAPAPLPLAGSDDEAALSAELHDHTKRQPTPYGHMRTVQPAEPPKAAPTAVTPPSDPAILSLANNDDFNVATLAREAKKAKGDDSQDEIVISLR